MKNCNECVALVDVRAMARHVLDAHADFRFSDEADPEAAGWWSCLVCARAYRSRSWQRRCLHSHSREKPRQR